MSEITEELKVAIADRYVIERELGAGGMATVYLAHDVKHDRKVALKVLRPELAAVIGAERFLQEIKVTANLQHSHILPLYDSGAAEGFLYYVMPYVEGETLRTKLTKEKQLGVEQAIALTRAVAAALEHAHKQGVIHRDIKPENILLRDNDPLIADFGIALALSHAGGHRLTETGLSIGTPHYMSPEQAMGDRELDARSDVYSLGAMLYEMLTGDPPYTGSTAQAIVAKVLTEKAPPVTILRETVPEHVSTAITKALAKLPADRFGSAASFAEALVTPGYVTPTQARTGALPGAAARPGWRRWTWPAIAVVLLAAALWGWLRPASEPPLPPPTRFALNMTGAPIAPSQGGRLLDVSPDGSAIAYVGVDTTGTQQIFLRPADGLTVTAIPGTDGALNPEFSPDGEWLAFSQGSDLKRVRLAGGSALTIARNVNAWGVHWNVDNSIIFRDDARGTINVVPAGGGSPRVVVRDSGGTQLRWPELLPDGQSALITVFPSLEGAQIAVLDLADGSYRVIVQEGTHPHYVSTGHIVYGHPEGGAFAVPFDVAARRVTGDPAPLIDDVRVFGGGAVQFAASDAGTAAYALGHRGNSELVLVDRRGVVTDSLGEPGAFDYPRFSPDGSRIAVANAGDVFVYDLSQRTLSRLTFVGGVLYSGWSHDGISVLYSTDLGNSLNRDIYRQRADGSAGAESVVRIEGSQSYLDAAADGTVLFRVSSEGGTDVQAMSPGDTAPRPLLAGNGGERAASLSPDDHWMAYISDETGTYEVYVTSFPTPSGRWQVSQGGGQEPVWSPDGRSIFYWAGAQMMEATVQTSPTFSVTGQRRLFVGTFSQNSWAAGYDIAPDGRHFVMIRGSASAAQSVIVTVNWFTELRERMAIK